MNQPERLHHAATAIAIGTLTPQGDEFQMQACGYWRIVEHDNEVMIAITPTIAPRGAGQPVAIEVARDAPVSELLKALRAAGGAIPDALFGDSISRSSTAAD